MKVIQNNFFVQFTFVICEINEELFWKINFSYFFHNYWLNNKKYSLFIKLLNFTSLFNDNETGEALLEKSNKSLFTSKCLNCTIYYINLYLRTSELVSELNRKPFDSGGIITTVDLKGIFLSNIRVFPENVKIDQFKLIWNILV